MNTHLHSWNTPAVVNSLLGKKNPTPAPAGTANALNLGMSKRILIVDDDASVREMLARVLTEEGYRAAAIPNGEEVLETSADPRIDLVLLDLNLPVSRAWDTLSNLTVENPHLAVIVLTTMPKRLVSSLGRGIGAVLEKPLDIPQLLRTIRDLLAERAETRRGVEPSRIRQSHDPVPPESGLAASSRATAGSEWTRS